MEAAVGFTIMMVIVSSIFWYVFVSICIGFVAYGRGRSGFDWAILALIVSPLVAYALLALLPMRYYVHHYKSNGHLKFVWKTGREIEEDRIKDAYYARLKEKEERHETDTDGTTSH